MSEKKTKRPPFITEEAIASYPCVVTPRQNDRGQDRWSVALVFLPEANLKPMKKLAAEVLTEKHGKDALKKVKAGKLHWPFRDDADDVAEKGYPEGSTFINVSSGKQPGVVSLVPDAQGRPTPIDPSVIYPGAIVRASLDCYCFDYEGKKKGVTFGLRNLQFIRDGERLDSYTNAADDFEADPNAVASLGALDGDDEPADEDPNADDDDLSDLL